MQTKNIYKRVTTNKLFLFLVLEFFLYLYFLYLDFFQTSHILTSNYIKFSGITFCCLFLFPVNEKDSLNPYTRLTKIALIATLWADVFLLFTNHATIGILLFSMVQGCYHLRLRPEQGLKDYCVTVFSFFLPSLLLLMLIGIHLETSLLCALFYFICLLCNGLTSLRKLKQPEVPRLEKLFSIGVLLLFVCDIQVGIYNVSSYIDIVPIHNTFFSFLQKFASIGMWAFYLPSQIIITICGARNDFSLNFKK